MNRTPLFDGHVAAGAKLVDFAGWEMPVRYSGVVDEVHAVRQTAGLFDVSHMGRIVLSGGHALAFLQRVTTNDASRLGLCQSQYSMVCNDRGGIKDDVFLYRVKDEEFLLCVNAANREKIAGWLREQATGWTGLEIRDRSQDLAQLALQGPASRSILTSLGVTDLAAIRPRQCVEAPLSGARSLIARTGYTGELGYELYVPADKALVLWTDLLTAGKAAGLKPAGLGARDLLRLEMAYLLYGNDISEETTPIEANAGWVVDLRKNDFIGRDALEQQHESRVLRRLVAFELVEKAVPRQGFKIVNGHATANRIGEVTSGNFSPMLQKGIGLAYVPPAYAKDGATFAIDIRGKLVPAIVIKPPFYKKSEVG